MVEINDEDVNVIFYYHCSRANFMLTSMYNKHCRHSEEAKHSNITLNINDCQHFDYILSSIIAPSSN